jgi:hypothetical protein
VCIDGECFWKDEPVVCFVCVSWVCIWETHAQDEGTKIHFLGPYQEVAGLEINMKRFRLIKKRR